MFDDDDFDFGDEDGSAEDWQEKKRQVNKHPLMVQAKEILQIVDALIDTCKDAEAADMYGGTLRESAMVVLAKLSSGLAIDSYLACMQNAAIIRDHAQYLRLSNHMLGMSEGFDEQHVEMFRREMETFRELFNAWAKEIHKMERDVEDEWGLF